MEEKTQHKRRTETSGICSKCGCTRAFYNRVVNGVRYYYSFCWKCRSNGRLDTTQKTREGRYLQKRQTARRTEVRGPYIAQEIYYGSRKWDGKYDLLNDLTREIIEKLISVPCQYCGENELRMTLDRMDNERGHSQDNVVPACIRCNNIRRNMPYETWLFLVPHIREARERGLFKGWNAFWQKSQKPLRPVTPPPYRCRHLRLGLSALDEY
jgi:hypothetical protein